MATQSCVLIIMNAFDAITDQIALVIIRMGYTADHGSSRIWWRLLERQIFNKAKSINGTSITENNDRCSPGE